MSFTRQLPIARADSDPQPGADITLSMSFASDEPYERWWGVEILECAPECVRLGRINDAGPLLYNHDWDQIRGHHVPGSVRADGRTVRGEVVISHAADDGRTIALIRGGHLSKSSTSYEIHAIVEQSTHKDGSKRERTLDARLFERILTRQEQTARGDLEAFRRSLDAAAGPFERAVDEPTIYRVTDWEILENSLVTVPADHTVGVGRSHASDTQHHQPAAPATHHPQGATPMSEDAPRRRPPWTPTPSAARPSTSSAPRTRTAATPSTPSPASSPTRARFDRWPTRPSATASDQTISPRACWRTSPSAAPPGRRKSA